MSYPRDVRSLNIPPDARVTFLTGAGVSVASGLRPYRGPGGLWNEVEVDSWATARALVRDPVGCFHMHRRFHALTATAKPNEAHRAIAAFEQRQASQVTVITQNVDSLHQRAGSSQVLEVHGSLSHLRCSAPSCGMRSEAPDPSTELEEPPSCPRCLERMRYDIVLFDEALSAASEWAAKRALRECDVFIAVGTSGVVYPAASYVREADYAGARTVLVNLEAPSPPNPYFHEVILGKAEELLPTLLDVAS